MADETEISTETISDPTETVETEPVLEKVLNPDGTFKEGWTQMLVPEDLRANKVYATIKDLPGMIKMLGHQASLIGKQGKGIMPLGEKATATEVEMYRKAMGIPDKPDGYQWEPPSGLSTFYKGEVIQERMAAYHAAQLTPAQVKAVMDLDASALAAVVAEDAKADQEAKETCEAELKKTWGDQTEAHVSLANRLVTETLDEKESEDVLAIIGNHPNVVRLFAKIGEQYLEDKTPSDGGGSPTGLLSEIERLEATPGYVSGELKRTNRKEHDRVAERLRFLYVKQYPNREPTA